MGVPPVPEENIFLASKLLFGNLIVEGKRYNGAQAELENEEDTSPKWTSLIGYFLIYHP